MEKAQGLSAVPTPAKFAHRVSRFSQTAKQHLLTMRVRRPRQLVLWTGNKKRERKKKDNVKSGKKKSAGWFGPGFRNRGEKFWGSFKMLRVSDWLFLICITHRCPQPPPLDQWHLLSSEDRWRTEPTWNINIMGRERDSGIVLFFSQIMTFHVQLKN